MEAIQGLQWALLDAERRGGDVKDKLLEAYKEARDEARRADALAHDLEAANMRNLILARTVNARAALGTYGTYAIMCSCLSHRSVTACGAWVHAERIQEKILKKPGAKMDEKDWSKYVDSRPALKARMLEQAPRWAKTLGRDILSIWQITNQRANGEQVGDVIEVFQEWFTREQIWVLGCILTEESYPWTALPAREGFSHVEQKRAMGLKKKKD